MKNLLIILAVLFCATGAVAQQVTPIGPIPPCTAFGTTSTTCATGLAASNAPYFRVYRNTSAQSLTAGSATTVQFNAVGYDPASICDTGSTYVCTPNVAGTYYFYCQIDVLSTTGPALGNNALADAQIAINGTAVSDLYVTPQVATLAAPRAFASTSAIVQMNGTTDTVGCKSSNDSTAPTAVNGATLTFMYGFRTGS